MATYKVPQDVESEDKIIGFLSLKQFIFVLVMIASLWMCWVLAKIQMLLGVIPLPIALVSGILGLYQRKDQPIEVYLASWLRFKTKTRTRKWDQEGLENRVIITAPKVIEKNYTKGLTKTQVDNRLTQLSALLDTRGWASKHGLQADTGQRLFSMQELSQYANPNLPIDGDVAKVVDQLDGADPRNRTAQEVNRDFTATTRRQRQEALDVVERARREAEAAAPKPPVPEGPKPIPQAEPQSRPLTKIRSNTPTNTSGQPSASHTTKSERETADTEDGVVIDLHHHKK